MSVGPWVLSQDGGRYELPEASPHWADVAEFSRVPAGRRVLLLGESVARGLFHDPIVTPAGLLQQALTAGFADPVEVVDLAKNGARVHDLLDTAEQARELLPDAVVLFAGNNWKYELSEWCSADLLHADAEALRHGGIAGLLRRRETTLATVSRSVVQRVGELYADVAPVVVVLPESNLLDWRPAALTPVLGDGDQLRWLALMAAARDRVQAGDWAGVLEACAELHDVDGGLSDQAYRYRAEAHRQRGELAAALADYRRARDVRLWCDGVDPSWLPTAGVVAAREAATECGATVVDLTSVLPDQCASGIPDRSVFYDFCHLNGRGLVVAATEMAHAVGAVLGAGAERAEYAAALREPPPAVTAGAAFCAAMVNADFGQDEELIASYAQEALAAAPEIADVAAAYCSAPVAPVPWHLRGLDLPGPDSVRRFVLGIARTSRYRSDDTLVTSFEAATGREWSGADRALVPGAQVDLLDPMFAPAWRPVDWEGLLGALPGIHGAHRHYFRAHQQSSVFRLVVAEPADIDIDLTARLGTAGLGSARVLVNGTEAGTVPLAERWSRSNLRVSAELVRKGPNTLEIRWDRQQIGTTPLSILADRLAQGLGQELSVVFGELYSLLVSSPGDGTDRSYAPVGEHAPTT